MVICPLCEHQQDFGLECEVCGKDLGGLGSLGPPPVAEERVEGLEVTVPARVGEVAVERLGELDPGRFGEVRVAEEVLPELDLARAGPVGEVPIERVPDLTVDRAPSDGVRTPAPGAVVACRYCGTPGAPGSLCARCGYKLVKLATVPVAVAAAGRGEPESVRCKACGAPAVAGEPCGDCGQPVPASES